MGPWAHGLMGPWAHGPMGLDRSRIDPGSIQNNYNYSYTYNCNNDILIQNRGTVNKNSFSLLAIIFEPRS